MGGTQVTKTLEQRVARLEAINDIRSLKMAYTRWCDAGYQLAQLRELFLEDAVWDGGETFGRYEGASAVRDFFVSTAARVEWTMHYIVSGDIQVAEDLQSATGSWYLSQPLTLEGEAVWLLAKYEDRYDYTDAGWRIAHLGLNVEALTPFHKGWVEERFIEQG